MLAGRIELRHRRGLLALVALTLAAHLALLGGIDVSLPQRDASRAAALQVRTLTMAAAPPADAAPPAPVPATPEPARKPRPRQEAARAAPPAPPAPAAAPVAVAEDEAPVQHGRREPDPEAVPQAQIEAAPAEPAASAAAPAGDPEAMPPPLYATRLPPPLTLRYELRRGRLSGSGELLWRPAGGRYSLRLEGSVMGLNVLTQESTGTLEPHGLMPERFTDQRARRPMVAANFEREAGRIRFSGPSTELPWQAGVQDRLSWMMQLAGVAEAEPQHLASGERIVMQVVGARGDASIWAFRSLGPEPLAIFGDSLATVHLLREPRHPYDTRVEVWLDPARHHLPVRATMGSGDEDRLELRLREAIP